jgi:hypothetical protein
MGRWATISTSAYSDPSYGQPPSLREIRREPWRAEVADPRPPGPSAGALVGASLWALGSAIVTAVVGVAALIILAGDPPTWYQPSMLTTGTVSLTGTISGLCLVEVAWVRWKLLAIGSTAIIIGALLTVAALTGIAS